jgi:CRP-like cAMP-binding protein
MGAGASLGSGISSGDAQSRLAWMRKMPCFSSLDDVKIKKVADKAHQMVYAKNEKIIEEGTVGTLFGILIQGTVVITATGAGGKEIDLCQQSRGYFFGDLFFGTTTATIKSLEAGTTILALTSKDLQELTVHAPEVREKLLETVSMRLKNNILKIPFFAQMENILQSKKYFKVLGVFDLLSTLFDMETFKAKELIFKEGDIGEKFFVVCEGCVRISCKDPSQKEITLNMLTKNEVFGEIALLGETTRTATARAFESTLALSITRDRFESLFRVFPNFEEIMRPLLEIRTANTIKAVPFFSNLSKEKREMIGQLFSFCSFPAGMTIVNEGDDSTGIYMSLEGKVQATTKSKVTGEIISLNRIDEYELMGEVALLAGCKRTCTLITIEPCRLLYMASENSRRFITLVPELLDDMISKAQWKRLNSIEANAEAEELIPKIDETKEGKLHLFALLRGMSDEEMDRERFPSAQPSTEQLLTIQVENQRLKHEERSARTAPQHSKK